MDLFLPIVLFIVFCILFSICGWCCKKHREGTVHGFVGNPAVTITTQAAPSIVPPYPVDQRNAPHGHAYVPTGYQSAPYPITTSPYPPAPGAGYPPTTPYPVTVAGPYPPTNTSGYPPPNTAPYPPGNVAPYTYQQQPPSYMEAVGHSAPPAEPRPNVNDGHSKQAPYNPHY